MSNNLFISKRKNNDTKGRNEIHNKNTLRKGYFYFLV